MLHWLDIAVIIGYLILIGALGLYFSRENTSTEEYFLGDRKFSGWLIGVSLVGTSISSITFLSFPGDAFKTTWFRIITTWAMPLSVLVAAYVFLPFFRRGKKLFQRMSILKNASVHLSVCMVVLHLLLRN